MKTRIATNRKVPQNLIVLVIICALVGASDIVSPYATAVEIVKICILAILVIEIINSIMHQSRVQYDELCMVGFMLFTVLSGCWSEKFNAYDYAANCIYIWSAGIMYLAYKRFGDRSLDCKIAKIFRVVELLDLILVFNQAVLQHINSDFANGIFGSTHYYNGIQGLFCTICCCISLYLCILEVRTKRDFVIDVLVSCLICALAEIKTFFFLVLGIIVFYVVYEHKNEKNLLRRVATIVGIAFAIYIAFNILTVFYGQNTVVFTNKQAMLQYLGYKNGGYGSGSRFGDVTAFLKNDLITIMLGKGFPEGMKLSVYGLASLLNSIGVMGTTLLGIFFLANIMLAKKKGKTDFYFVIMCTGLCVMAEIAWAGIFGSTVSYFSLIIFSMVNEKGVA